MEELGSPWPSPQVFYVSYKSALVQVNRWNRIKINWRPEAEAIRQPSYLICFRGVSYWICFTEELMCLWKGYTNVHLCHFSWIDHSGGRRFRKCKRRSEINIVSSFYFLKYVPPGIFLNAEENHSNCTVDCLRHTHMHTTHRCVKMLSRFQPIKVLGRWPIQAQLVSMRSKKFCISFRQKWILVL